MRPLSLSANSRPSPALFTLIASTLLTPFLLGAGAAEAAIGADRLSGHCTITLPHGWPAIVSFDLDLVSHPTFHYEHDKSPSLLRRVAGSLVEEGVGVDRHMVARLAVEEFDAGSWTGGPVTVAVDVRDAAVTGDTLQVEYDPFYCEATVTKAATTEYRDPYSTQALNVETARVQVGVTLPTLEACTIVLAFSQEGRVGKLEALVRELEVTTEGARQLLPLVADEEAGTLTGIFTSRQWYDLIAIETTSRISLATLIQQRLYRASTPGSATVQITSCPD